MNILIIDDNKADRDLIITNIKKIKSNQDITTDESNCVKDAVSKIHSNIYDLIILDLVLPESDGSETVKKIMTTIKETEMDIPIIVLTGTDNYKIGREIWDLGIKDYLIKDEIKIKDLSRALNFATYDKTTKQKWR